MIRSLLIDLDDTLLGNSLDTFMNQYFAILSRYAASKLDSSMFLPSLLSATRSVISNVDPGLTNDQVFWHEFSQLTGRERSELEPFFQRFYEEDFDQLKPYTELKPSAAILMQTAADHGLEVVVATNPLFPLIAIHKRLVWAGVSADVFDYALITSYENMHSAKPRPEYYREILTIIDSTPEQAIMVGDDWENDISPALAAGLSAYWIAGEAAVPPSGRILGQGSLEAFADLVARGWLEELDLTR